MAKTKVYAFGARELWLWQYRGHWYGCWHDEAGKRRKRTLKTTQHSVAVKRLADLAAELDQEARQATRPTLEQFASRLLDDADDYLKQRGLTEHTIYAKKRCIRILVDWFGADRLGETTEATIERRLRVSGYSGSYQSEIMDAYSFVIERAIREGFDVRKPEFYRPDRKSVRRDSLTPVEVRALFPDDPAEIGELYDEGEGFGLMFGLLYRTILHAGLRPGEGRAVGRHQLYTEHNALVVSRRLDRHNEPQELKKRRYGDTDVFRIVALPSSTVKLLTQWIEQTEPQDYLFLYHGEPVRQRYISERWGRVLERVRIGEDKRPMTLAERKLDVQALRVTYRSMTEGWMPRSALLDAMGHRSADVHDGYLRFLERQVEAVTSSQRELVESVWATRSDSE